MTPLGAKGVGEGVSMSTPVCIANAVADALGAGEVLELPLLPARLAPHVAAALARRRDGTGQHAGQDEPDHGAARAVDRRGGEDPKPGARGARG